MWGEGIPGGKDGIISGAEWDDSTLSTFRKWDLDWGLEYRAHSLENLPNSTPTDFNTGG